MVSLSWKFKEPEIVTPFTIGSSTVFLKTVRANILVQMTEWQNTKPNVTAIHLHSPSTDGVNSGVLITLCDAQLANFSCPKVFADVLYQFGGPIQLPLALLYPVPLLYINIHTTQYPMGEIRAQLAMQSNMLDVIDKTPAPPQNPTQVKSDAPTRIISFFLSVFASVLAFSI
jgi:hypothetical protein